MLTPLEIHNKEFKRSFRGYDEEEVDEFLDQVIADYEQLYKENIDLREMLSRTEGSIGQYKDLEDTLKNALVVAQQTSDKMKINAEKEAEMIIQEAQAKSERMITDAQVKFEKLVHDYERLKNQVLLFRVKLKSFLELQLAMVDEYEEGLLKEESKKTIFPDESKQKLIKEVNEDVAQLDKINSSINEIVDRHSFVSSPGGDFDLRRELSEVAGKESNEAAVLDNQAELDTDQLNTYDLKKSGTEESKNKTILFSREEIAAAIDDSVVKDKTIY